MTLLIKTGTVSALIILLILMRTFAPSIFYDPFIYYFKNDFLIGSFPNYGATKLLLSTFLRYAINMLISLTILYLIFQNKKQLVFVSKFYGIAFILLVSVYFYQLNSEFSNGYLLPFYIRRLLIHPVFLLILIPAFYYQKVTKAT